MASESATRFEQGLAEHLGAEAARLLAETPHGAMLLGTEGLIWANEPAGQSLGLPRETLLARGLPASAPGTRRLESLLAGTPSSAPSLERLRFFVGLRGVMRLAGCRRLTLAHGQPGLLVVFLDEEPNPAEAGHWPKPLLIAEPMPTVTPEGSAEELPAAGEAIAVPQPPAPVPSLPLWLSEPEGARQSRRFLFSLDAEGRVLSVTPPLAETVGVLSAAIEGHLLPDVLRRHDEAAANRVTEALAAGETFSGIRVIWPVDGRTAFVPVDLSALPLVSTQEGLTGFSGFGHCRIDQARIEPVPVLRDAAPEAGEAASEDRPAQAFVADFLTMDVVEPAEAPEKEQPVEHLPEQPGQLAADMAEGESATQASFAETDEPASDPASLDKVAADLEAFVREQVRDASPPPDAPQAPEPSDEDAKIVSLRTGQPTQPMPGFRRQGLSMTERNAFREIAKALGARFDEDTPQPAEMPAPQTSRVGAPQMPLAAEPLASLAGTPPGLLDRLPIGLLVLRGDDALFANRTLLDLTGYADIAQFRAEDGTRAIFRKGVRPRESTGSIESVVLTSREGEIMPVDAHLQLVEWEGSPATLISLRRAVELEQGRALRSVAQDLTRARADISELRAILDTATDGVAILDEKGTILGLNGAAQALFGVEQNEIVGESFTHLLHRDSHAEALDYLEGMRSASGMRSVFNDGREISGREKKGGRIPLFMTLGRISDEEPKRFCAVLRDMTAWKRAEAGLTEARQAAEMANAKKGDFLAKISHEIRTPMNAIIGFADLMQEERLGPLGNPKYKEYLGDIRTSGQHVVSLVNDLLDLAKIEAGRMELNFAAIDLNAIVASTVALIQPQATQNRVLVRTQLAQNLPPVVADERSIRQIVLNMLSNATRFTEAGGQVIVSTSMLSTGEVAIRIRDTGIGMTANEIEQALEPFRQVGRDRAKGGTGLGLPLTKALVEANRANFDISSKPGEGTMVEIIFPPTRVLAE